MWAWQSRPWGRLPKRFRPSSATGWSPARLTIPIQKVSVNFLTQSAGDIAEIELIAPLSEDSPIKSMLAKGSGGAYHLCFETTDIERALIHAKNNGCMIVSQPVPAVAFNGRRIAWIYTPSRQLFELVEAEV